MTHSVHRSANTLLTFASYRYTFRPTAGYDYPGQGSQVEALGAVSAVGYEVHLQEARVVFLVVGEGLIL